MNQSHLYSYKTVRKRSGGERAIHAPFWPLANIQRRLHRLLEELYRPSSRVMGFVAGRDIRTNAQFHVGKRLVLNIDLVDFFGSIHAGRVRRRLMARPYGLSDDVATTIAKLCTLNDVLPTGAPTSPILANIVMSSLDGALTKFGREHGCFYTRYADDITFSTNKSAFPQVMVRRTDENISGVEVGIELEKIITDNGFKVQAKKTKLMSRSMRQEVCGVTCNERLNVRRTFYREVRGALNAWRKYGRMLAEEAWKNSYNWRQSSDYERWLRGKIAHIIHIRGKSDATTSNIVRQFNELPDRTYRDIVYHYTDNDPLGILNSVCLVTCADEVDPSQLHYGQGTGFVVDGGAILTNHHVVSYRMYTKAGKPRKNNKGAILPKKIFPEIRIRLEGGMIDHDMVVVYADERRDLVVLRPVDAVWNTFLASRAAPVSFGKPEVGMAVSVVGYPSHAEGGSVKIVPANVTGSTPYEGHSYFTVDALIVQGNSGGPVVDHLGQVVGIATKGIAPDEKMNLAFNGCIPMHTVDKAIFTSS